MRGSNRTWSGAALATGLWVALGGGSPVAQGALPVEAACAAGQLDAAQLAQLQRALNAVAGQATEAGEADGRCGPRTVAAIRAWQTSKGEEPTGVPTHALLASLAPRSGPPLVLGGAGAAVVGRSSAGSAPISRDTTEIASPTGVAPADALTGPVFRSALPSPEPPSSPLPQTVDPVTGRPYLR